MTPDWTQAPKGAQYFNVNTGLWYRRKFFEVQVWRDDAWKYTHTTPLIPPHFIERPDDDDPSGGEKLAYSAENIRGFHALCAGEKQNDKP